MVSQFNMETVLSQGAEAILLKKSNSVIKKRIEKGYRSPVLDKRLRFFRTKREVKVLEKASSLGIPVPKVNQIINQFTFEMEFIDGRRLRDHLIEQEDGADLLERVGEFIAKLHDEGIIHGDLTTSNILIKKDNSLFIIDFGLSFFSEKIEDKAVDIHLFKQAIESTHFMNKKHFFEAFKRGYSSAKDYEAVLSRLDVVEKRGRNKV